MFFSHTIRRRRDPRLRLELESVPPKAPLPDIERFRRSHVLSAFIRKKDSGSFEVKPREDMLGANQIRPDLPPDVLQMVDVDDLTLADTTYYSIDSAVDETQASSSAGAAAGLNETDTVSNYLFVSAVETIADI